MRKRLLAVGIVVVSLVVVVVYLIWPRYEPDPGLRVPTPALIGIPLSSSSKTLPSKSIGLSSKIELAMNLTMWQSCVLSCLLFVKTKNLCDRYFLAIARRNYSEQTASMFLKTSR